MFFEVMEEMSSSQTLRLLRIDFYSTVRLIILVFDEMVLLAYFRQYETRVLGADGLLWKERIVRFSPTWCSAL